MATIRKEFRSPRSADEVWALLKRFDAVHELAKGFVTATKMEPGGARLVTFANGMEVREWPVSADDGERCRDRRRPVARRDSPRPPRPARGRGHRKSRGFLRLRQQRRPARLVQLRLGPGRQRFYTLRQTKVNRAGRWPVAQYRER